MLKMMQITKKKCLKINEINFKLTKNISACVANKRTNTREQRSNTGRRNQIPVKQKIFFSRQEQTNMNKMK